MDHEKFQDAVLENQRQTAEQLAAQDKQLARMDDKLEYLCGNGKATKESLAQNRDRIEKLETIAATAINAHVDDCLAAQRATARAQPTA